MRLHNLGHQTQQRWREMLISTVPAPGVSQPVEAVQLIISQLKVVVSDVRRLFLQSDEPRPLLQHLEGQKIKVSNR